MLDTDERVGFVILQVDIITGLKLLNQGILQQERILFTFNDRKLNMMRMAYHGPGLEVLMLFIPEIGRQSMPEAFGFTDINHCAFGVNKPIDSRFFGNGICYAFKILVGHISVCSSAIIPFNKYSAEAGLVAKGTL